MAKTLANYDPLVQIPSGMTPAGADFPIVESHDILVGENDKRLDAKLDDIDSAIGNVGQTPIATQLSSKVNTGDIVTSVAATGSTSNNKIPSETAVRAAIEAKTINVDSTVTEGSTNAVSGGAVHTQLATKQDTLTFDTTPTASSSNPVTSGGVKTALDAKQDTLTFDTTPTASSSNPVTSGGVKAALDNKQNTLTYETTPIVGSVNPVTSTGIRNAIDTAAAANLGQMQAEYNTFTNNISARVSSLSNGMVACSNIAAETTVGDTRILLYTGTTNANYTNGHWYYNSAASNAAPSWTDGGAVGSAPTIDNTLTTAGAAADSKSVGDAIENIVTISNTQPGANSGNKVWIRETTNEEVQVPTYQEHISKANKADIATNNESDNGSGTITASKAYAIGDHFYINNTNTSSENYGVSTLYKATAAIASGSAIVVGTNCEASKVADEITSLSNDIDESLSIYIFGDNIVSMPASGKTTNGITFTVNEDTIVANGTATANAYIDVCAFTPATSGSYTLSGSPSGGKVGKYVLYIVDTNNFDTGNGATYTLNAGVEYKVRIIVYSGHVASNLMFTPVLTYNETGNGVFNTVKAELSDKVSGVKGNNIFDIPDYEGSPNGMKISIKGNRITLKGTNTTAIRLKLTHGIDVQNTEQDSWANESLSDMFEVGKQYCIAYKVYSGTFSYTIGTPARVSKSPSVSFLSVSVPKNIATAENMPKYIMLYIPINTTADVTFEPFFMEAFTQNDMFSYDVSEDVKITSKKTPKNQYNYFTVSVNTSTDDSVESVQTVNAVVTFPESYKAQGEKTPLIMYCHGRTDTVSVGDWVENDIKRRTLIESFVSGGYAVFDVDAISHPSAGAVDVGSPAIMQAYIKAWEYIKEHYNVEDKLFIYSLSFGSFVAFNMLSWYPTVIKTACLSAIRASHRSVFNRGTPYNAEIATNFSFNDSTGATYEADKMLGFDPYEDITDGKLLKSIPPIKALTSSADTLELTEAHTLISAWKAGGNYINYKEVSGLDHSSLCYLTDASLRNEVLAWFNRYRR